MKFQNLTKLTKLLFTIVKKNVEPFLLFRNFIHTTIPRKYIQYKITTKFSPNGYNPYK